jgi:hypothetical protein
MIPKPMGQPCRDEVQKIGVAKAVAKFFTAWYPTV